LILLAAILVFERFSGNYRFNQELARLKASGASLSLEDYVPPAALDNQNVFVALAEIALKLEGFPRSDIPSSVKITAPGYAIPGHQIKEIVVEPDLEVDDESRRVVQITPDDQSINWAAIESELGSYDVSIADLETALAKDRFRTSFTFTNSFDEDLVYLSGMKTIGIYLSKHVAIGLRRGDMEAAVRANVATWILAKRLSEEPLLITQLVAAALGKIAAMDCWTVLSKHEPTVEQIDRLLEASEGVKPYFGRSANAERAMTVDSFFSEEWSVPQIRERIHHYYDNDVFGLHPNLIVDGWVLDRVFVPVYAFAWRRHDASAMLREWQHMVDRITGGTEGVWIDFEEDADSVRPLILGIFESPEEKGFYLRWKFLFASMSSVSNDAFVRRYFQFVAERNLARTALGLHRHRIRTGRYPEELADLVPTDLPAVPEDPMDGMPLRYRRETDDNFTLWSIGLDAEDDGGAVDLLDENLPAIDPWNWKDFVWLKAAE
jgi:hypothetical protein